MANLVIGGVTVLATEFTRAQDEASNQPQRTISGQLRGEPDWVKRAWNATAYCADDAAAVTLRAAIPSDAAVTVSGDLIGGSISARVQVTQDEYVPERLTWYRMIGLTIREV